MNLKQKIYINTRLKNISSPIYYEQNNDNFQVYIDNSKYKSVCSPVYGLNFNDNECALNFKDNKLRHDKQDFNVFVYKNDLFIEPKRMVGAIKIDCGQNEEMAKMYVKRFRTQYVASLNREMEKSKNQESDVNGLQL